jgi:hypothetical protein
VKAVVLSEAEREMWIDLRPYMDPCPITVHVHTPLARGFKLFRTVGLRHLFVINNSHDVVGIITRHELTLEHLKVKAEEAILADRAAMEDTQISDWLDAALGSAPNDHRPPLPQPWQLPRAATESAIAGSRSSLPSTAIKAQVAPVSRSQTVAHLSTSQAWASSSDPTIQAAPLDNGALYRPLPSPPLFSPPASAKESPGAAPAVGESASNHVRNSSTTTINTLRPPSLRSGPSESSPRAASSGSSGNGSRSSEVQMATFPVSTRSQASVTASIPQRSPSLQSPPQRVYVDPEDRVRLPEDPSDETDGDENRMRDLVRAVLPTSMM